MQEHAFSFVNPSWWWVSIPVVELLSWLFCLNCTENVTFLCTYLTSVYSDYDVTTIYSIKRSIPKYFLFNCVHEPFDLEGVARYSFDFFTYIYKKQIGHSHKLFISAVVQNTLVA